MLTAEDLKKLATAGTGPRIDILMPGQANVERIARSLVALANTHGGVLIIPTVDPRGRTSLPKDELTDRALQATLLCEPHLFIPFPYLVAGDSANTPMALTIEVPDGLPRAYCLNGQYLARSGSRIVTLTARALRELLLMRGEESWEALTPSGSSRDDIDWTKVEAYVAATHTGEPTAEDLLLRRGCIVRQGKRIRPTHAGLLLFGKQPQRWVRGAEVIAVRFNGTSMEDAFERLTISNTLPEQIRHAELFISEHQPQRSLISGWRRDDHPPYPPGVLREAVVNALAHRDYRISGNQVHILMFSDRVEVRSPGKLPGHVTLKNLLHERFSRNEAIVQVLADMGYIERLGYGIDRMVRTMREHGQAAPRFEETEAGFCVTLMAHAQADDEIVSLTTSAQTQRIEKMLAFVKENGRITNRDYQELCADVGPESLRRDFVDMVQRGVILRVGDKRGTYYILK